VPASIALIAAVLLIAGLALALAVIVSAPILAVPFFVFGLLMFLLWRASKRADTGSAP
jgi:hypothetical protein